MVEVGKFMPFNMALQSRKQPSSKEKVVESIISRKSVYLEHMAGAE
jgi:hypothetical protein